MTYCKKSRMKVAQRPVGETDRTQYSCRNCENQSCRRRRRRKKKPEQWLKSGLDCEIRRELQVTRSYMQVYARCNGESARDKSRLIFTPRTLLLSTIRTTRNGTVGSVLSECAAHSLSLSLSLVSLPSVVVMPRSRDTRWI